MYAAERAPVRPVAGIELKENRSMPIGALIHRHPMRAAASAMLDAERALDEIQRSMNSYPTLRVAGGSSFAPHINAVEGENDYAITAELPGVEQSDLSVSIEDGILHLSGIRKSASWSEDLSDEEKAKREVRFERRFRFNGEIADDAVKAIYRNGLLEVSVPKAEPPKPEVKSIPVEMG
jgi:HSP20 family protein